MLALRMPKGLRQPLMIAVSLLLFGSKFMPAEPSQLINALVQNSYEYRLAGNSGAGREVLRKAISESQFVLIGEAMHGTQETARFSAAICAMAAQFNFHTMAIETGPIAAGNLRTWTSRPDRIEQLIRYTNLHPLSIPFYGWFEENDALAACAQFLGSDTFQLWGLDQEFFGGVGPVLEHMLASNPAKELQSEGVRLLTLDKLAIRNFRKSGSPYDLSLMSFSGAEFACLKGVVTASQNEYAKALLHSLILSRNIYRKHSRGATYEANRERALLMKLNFMSSYIEGGGNGPTPPKVILKFGDYHLYRGTNPLHSNEIGSLVSELAESRQLTSLHILVVPVRGMASQLAEKGENITSKIFDLQHDADSDYLFLQLLFANQKVDAWTLFDLRALRSHFAELGKMDEGLERVIFGYDLLLVIPNASASHEAR